MSIEGGYPDAQNVTYPDTRDTHLAAIEKRFLAESGMDLTPFQDAFLHPPPPYDIKQLKYVQMGGAKRLGKSMILGFRAALGAPLPHHVTRLYADDHEIAKREFDWIDYFLFKSENALCKTFPQLLSERVAFNNDTKQGRLEMRWSWGSEIASRSWERRNQWVGEPVDLAIICEPGLFPDGTVFSHRIEPNLQDRRGICYSSGTVDNPWLYDYHEMGHNHSEHPDIFCVCEIPRWANLHVFKHIKHDQEHKLGREISDSEWYALIRAEIAQAKERLTARDFAINWEGHWDNYSQVAIDNFEPAKHVKIVSEQAHASLEMIPGNWDHFLSCDTGGYCAIGEYIVDPSGTVMMINEYTNYEYRAGSIVLVDFQGFRDFFKSVLRTIMNRRPGMNRPIMYGDPSSQFKIDVTTQECGWIDAVNTHDYGTNAVNEYLGKRKMLLVRPSGRPAYNVEREMPRVKWRNDARKKLDDTTRGHSFDQFRYALASRPLASDFVRDRELSTIEKDIMGIRSEKIDDGDPLLGSDGMG